MSLIVDPEVDLWSQIIEASDFGAMIEMYPLAPSFRTFSRDYMRRDELVSALRAFSADKHLLVDIKLDGNLFWQVRD